jgi:hypothetical protein
MAVWNAPVFEGKVQCSVFFADLGVGLDEVFGVGEVRRAGDDGFVGAVS